MKVVVVDLGVGNIHSLSSALGFLNAEHVVTADPAVIPTATHVILPGVGAYDAAMTEMETSGLAAPIMRHACEHKKPVLGVCLGMQLLFQGSEEGKLRGLGILSGAFVKLTSEGQLKVPHVGFASVYGYRDLSLFQGFGASSAFYFTHSYALMTDPLGANVAYCDHHRTFVAAFQKGNICGAQFHPEKSQSNGLRLLANFLEL